jgi:F420-0:gamma-glutamyl ligase-like protein
MSRYQALAVATRYWNPRTDYMNEIAVALNGKVGNGDFVVVSEKAISTAKGNLVDESQVRPSLAAKFLATMWMRVSWGYSLGILCHFGQRLLIRLRNYPADEGSRHKQVSLQYAGFSQALMFGSEGGIDGSNLPYSLVSLPLKNSEKEARTIADAIRRRLGKKITVIIVDSDKTYSLGNFHFTPRPQPIKGINSLGGVVAYILGRIFKLHRRPTPLAVAGLPLSVEEALTVANVADRARGPGSGATVWDMAARFKVASNGVTWEMLAQVKHKPIVIVRKASSQRFVQSKNH